MRREISGILWEAHDRTDQVGVTDVAKKKKEERLLLYSGNNNNRRSIRLLPVPRISTNPRISSRCRSLLVWGFVQLGLRHDN